MTVIARPPLAGRRGSAAPGTPTSRSPCRAACHRRRRSARSSDRLQRQQPSPRLPVAAGEDALVALLGLARRLRGRWAPHGLASGAEAGEEDLAGSRGDRVGHWSVSFRRPLGVAGKLWPRGFFASGGSRSALLQW